MPTKGCINCLNLPVHPDVNDVPQQRPPVLIIQWVWVVVSVAVPAFYVINQPADSLEIGKYNYESYNNFRCFGLKYASGSTITNKNNYSINAIPPNKIRFRVGNDVDTELVFSDILPSSCIARFCYNVSFSFASGNKVILQGINTYTETFFRTKPISSYSNVTIFVDSNNDMYCINLVEKSWITLFAEFFALAATLYGLSGLIARWFCRDAVRNASNDDVIELVRLESQLQDMKEKHCVEECKSPPPEIIFKN